MVNSPLAGRFTAANQDLGALIASDFPDILVHSGDGDRGEGMDRSVVLWWKQRKLIEERGGLIIQI